MLQVSFDVLQSVLNAMLVGMVLKLRRQVKESGLSINIVNRPSKTGDAMPASSYIATTGTMTKPVVEAIEGLWDALHKQAES